MSTQIPITADDILKIVEVMKKHEIKPLRVGIRLTARLLTANDPIGRKWKIGKATLAWHFIETDAQSLAEVGEMMDAWLAANQTDTLIRPPGKITQHWLGVALERVCAGEAEADVLADYGWTRTP